MNSIRQLITFIILLFCVTLLKGQNVDKQFIDPPREFSLMPFWFWNDTLKAEEILRQIEDFENHGVYGFVIHPRMGLPASMKFLDEKMLGLMKLAIEEAEKRKMKVILYDEGSYPSGSCEGQVVAKNPEHAARGLFRIEFNPDEDLKLEENWQLVSKGELKNGKHFAIVERPSQGHIRGLHWTDEEKGKEDTPPAGDILNPEAVTSFINLVYDRFYENFGQHFGKTVIAIFTDEPDPLGRGPIRGMKRGNAKLLPRINEILGYNFTPFLNDLWTEESENWEKHRKDYDLAITICLEENYYGRLSEWCASRNVALTGHPAGSMDLGAQKYFQIPGQDLVWRYVEPGEKALNGQHSTMAKNASSAMVHLNRRRNSNELYGAYGHNLTYEEMVWLANWCFVRGQNLLYPHAFYYSVRGARFNERPPDVGPNAKWWNNYLPFADACRRLSWLNTDSKQICEVAILGDANWLPDESAKMCFQHQRDFNYLEIQHLLNDAKITNEGVKIGGMHYKTIILDGLSSLSEEMISALQQIADSGRLLVWKDSPFISRLPKALICTTPESLVNSIDQLISPDLQLLPHSTNIRYRHVVKNNLHYYLLFNEENSAVTSSITIPGNENAWWFDEFTAKTSRAKLDEPVDFQPFELKILMLD